METQLRTLRENVMGAFMGYWIEKNAETEKYIKKN